MVVKTDEIYTPVIGEASPASFRLKAVGNTETGELKIEVEGVVLLQANTSLTDFQRALSQARADVLKDLEKFGLKEKEEEVTQG